MSTSLKPLIEAMLLISRLGVFMILFELRT